jgi:hypothetical protein
VEGAAGTELYRLMRSRDPLWGQTRCRKQQQPVIAVLWRDVEKRWERGWWPFAVWVCVFVWHSLSV